MIPGFVDMHTHAPQYRNLGLGLDYTLLEWLEKVTFPEEVWYGRKHSDEGEGEQEYSERVSTVYDSMVKHYLRCGTTTCCYFGSIQLEANKILVERIAANGQRALIGKTCMDCNSPPNYVESGVESIEGTEEFIQYVRGVDSGLVHRGTLLPVVTPRFALTCTEPTMHALGRVAARTDAHIQSHMSENSEEIAFARKLFSSHPTYGSIYESMGLLTEKTIMAHCIHLSDDEYFLLKKYNVSIAHCPNSNFAINSGIMNVRRALSHGIRVGLGTDVSGGYAVSMLDAIRQAIIASKALYIKDPSLSPLSSHEALYLATLGGATALGLDARIGSFEPGKQFDALLVDRAASPVPSLPHESLEQHVQRFLFTGDDRWILSVFVNGCCLPL